jgi:5-carboxymethyl-2-hydroxymuconate isomerase
MSYLHFRHDGAFTKVISVVSNELQIFTKGYVNMPHIIAEYSANLESSFKPERLLKSLHSAAQQAGIFDPKRVRSRTMRRETFIVGEGNTADVFLHITIRMKKGRPHEVLKKLAEAIRAAAKTEMGDLFSGQPDNLTIEIQEIDTNFQF